MHPFLHNQNIPRRNFLASCGMGMGLSALAPLLNGQGNPMLPKGPHFAPKAKRVIHLFMNGGPSHVDTFDPKPELTKWHGKTLPEIVLTPNVKPELHTGLPLHLRNTANPDYP